MTDMPDEVVGEDNVPEDNVPEDVFDTEADLTEDEVVEPRDEGLASMSVEELLEMDVDEPDAFEEVEPQ